MVRTMTDLKPVIASTRSSADGGEGGEGGGVTGPLTVGAEGGSTHHSVHIQCEHLACIE